MTKQEIDFLVQNRINFDSVKLGFTRNISFDVLGTYEQIYRKYLDAGFILTYWCGGCVFEMLERLIRYCEDKDEYNQAMNPTEPTKIESAQTDVQPKKRGRPKK